MTKTLKLTRRGWIDHLAIVQKMMECVETLYEIPTHRSVIGPKDCETDRRKKLEKKFLEIRELLWETSAVSEKILREKAVAERCDAEELEGLSVEPWNDVDRDDESAAREAFARCAKDLEAMARGLWDETAPEVVSPEVVYPGGDGADETQPPKPPEEDPRQLRLGLDTGARPEPPRVDPGRLVDFKMQQANDDTVQQPDDDEEEEDQ